MTIFYRPVNFEHQKIQNDFQFYFENNILNASKIDHKGHDFRSVDISLFDKYDEFQNFLIEEKLILKFCMLFWCKPNARGNIHKDLDDFGLNIPISGIGGWQTWVDVDPMYPPVLSSYGNTSEKKFELFPLTTPFTVIEKYMVTQPTIVNTGVRHYIDNLDNDKFRIMLSMRLHRYDSTTNRLI
jgi:hypothetical protein